MPWWTSPGYKRQMQREAEAGRRLLARLKPEQIERVRKLLRSWGTHLTEANVHMPICRHAMRKVLNNHP